MWEEFRSIQVEGPWLCNGDFNSTLKDGERASNGSSSSSFIRLREDLRIFDLGYSDPKFAWNHELNIATKRFARLDRAICEEQWRRAFPEANLRHLPPSYLYHYPILLQLASRLDRYLGNCPFRFQVDRMEHKDFPKLHEDNWVTSGDLSMWMNKFSEVLVNWSKDVLGSIF